MLIKNEVHDFIVKVDIMLFPKKKYFVLWRIPWSDQRWK